MLVFGTELHIVTFLFAVLELLMFVFMLPGYLNRPEDKTRLLHLILLFLLILYNLTGGLLPDPKYPIPLFIQNIIAYGSGFIMASYFPYYFYKVFNLSLLRIHALYGVPLFLLTPFIVFFVVLYPIHENLSFTVRYGIISPFIYSLVLLWEILKSIRIRYKGNRQNSSYIEEIAVYLAIVPWGAMSIIAYFQFSQLTEAIVSNLGFLVVTSMFIFRFTKQDRNAISKLKDISINGIRPEIFEENCMNYEFTTRETEVIRLLQEGQSTGTIATRLFISERTVTTHIQNMMAKTQTHSRLELLRKLELGVLDT